MPMKFQASANAMKIWQERMYVKLVSKTASAVQNKVPRMNPSIIL
jgi:hypothetical protein